MTVPSIVSDDAYLRIDGKLVSLLKCPFCDFRNIHEETIRHHIYWNDDAAHSVDPVKIFRKELCVTKHLEKSRYYNYEKKEEYGLLWIECLWCDYSDCVLRDLEWHFLEKHKIKLYNEIGSQRYEPIDDILARAARIAVQRSEAKE